MIQDYLHRGNPGASQNVNCEVLRMQRKYHEVRQKSAVSILGDSKDKDSLSPRELKTNRLKLPKFRGD